jgi:hypothetical protein
LASKTKKSESWGDFFEAGDTGEYAGTAAAPVVVAEERSAVASDEHGSEQPASRAGDWWPEQEARKTNFIRIVAAVVGFALAVTLVAVLNSRGAKTPPEPEPPKTQAPRPQPLPGTVPAAAGKPAPGSVQLPQVSSALIEPLPLAPSSEARRSAAPEQSDQRAAAPNPVPAEITPQSKPAAPPADKPAARVQSPGPEPTRAANPRPARDDRDKQRPPKPGPGAAPEAPAPERPKPAPTPGTNPPTASFPLE